MKIISLNVWGGRVKNPLNEFFRAHADADIILLQEVFHNATEKTRWEERDNANFLTETEALLPDHRAIFAPVQDGEWGLAAFVSPSVSVERSDDVFVHRDRDAMEGRDGTTLGRNVQRLFVQTATGSLTFFNFHGLWTGVDKKDTDARIAQSRNLSRVVNEIPGKKVLCGDFNLMPDTESISIIERETGMRNLITEHGVTGTRTSFYTKPEKFADYTFVSPDIRVRDFRILPDEVSDHAAMYIELDI